MDNVRFISSANEPVISALPFIAADTHAASCLARMSPPRSTCVKIALVPSNVIVKAFALRYYKSCRGRLGEVPNDTSVRNTAKNFFGWIREDYEDKVIRRVKCRCLYGEFYIDVLNRWPAPLTITAPAHPDFAG